MKVFTIKNGTLITLTAVLFFLVLTPLTAAETAISDITDSLKETPITGNTASPPPDPPEVPPAATDSNNADSPDSNSQTENRPVACGTGRVCVEGARLNVRSGPWGDIIGKLHNGDLIEIVGEKDNWYEITFNGQRAFVHKAYIETQTGKRTAFTGTTTRAIEVLSGPNGERIGSLPEGAVIDEVLIKNGDWYEIKYNGGQGFVRADAIAGPASQASSSAPDRTDSNKAAPPEAASSPSPASPAPGTSPTGDEAFARKAESAIAWGKAHLGSGEFAGLCQGFVRRCYGAPGEYACAYDCYRAIGHSDSIENIDSVPVGALVFFDYWEGKNHWGHVGIHLGGGMILHACGTVKIESMKSGWLAQKYLGWGMPPAHWPGH